ncbi:EamA family transporter [Actinotalea sp. BY-33]|uniref:EamA family transporter n=1 Tax=Actinotalea soli TaxID=2819234 RepID=A0A939RSK8_9CELL|nr:DMT family transporter [Actinotalea soli]MBO1751657.1 EamA family transporter [Actinotalea soli]
MEATWRWVLVTAIAPISWGSTYYVTREFLPVDHPLTGAAIRALPAGLLLLAVCRRLPRGSWWWRSLVLGTLNMSAFFALVYLAAQLLPTSVASVIMATSSVAMMLVAWALLAERPGLLPALGATLGITGVATMLLTGAESVSTGGVLASVSAMLMSSVGYVLAKRWSGQVPVLASTSWQLVAGGLILVPVALVVEGPPPALDAPAVLAFAYVSVIATAVAFAAWFTGLRHLTAGTVALIGLLNPVTGVLLGTALAAESLTLRQGAGVALVLLGIALGQPAATRRWHRRAPVSGAGAAPPDERVAARAPDRPAQPCSTRSTTTASNHT